MQPLMFSPWRNSCSYRLACAYVAMSMVKKNSEMAVTLVTVLIAFGGEYIVAWNINRFIFKHVIS